jgi:hypothetical protein
VPTQDENPEDVKRFLGQANWNAKITWNNYTLGCCGSGIRANGPLLSKTLATLGVGDRMNLREIITDELLISLSEKTPVQLVPWDRQTFLVPSDVYVLKPIPGLGIAVSMKVRIL